MRNGSVRPIKRLEARGTKVRMAAEVIRNETGQLVYERIDHGDHSWLRHAASLLVWTGIGFCVLMAEVRNHR